MHHVCNFLSASRVVLVEGKVGFEFDCCLPDEIGDVLCAKVHRPVETGDDGPHSHACWTAVLVYTCHDHISMIIFCYFIARTAQTHNLCCRRTLICDHLFIFQAGRVVLVEVTKRLQRNLRVPKKARVLWDLSNGQSWL